MITTQQRRLLFEEATRKGFILASLPSVPEYYQQLFGVRDMGAKKYGLPFTKPYVAVEGENIVVEKLSTYLTNLHRDVKVVDMSATELEDKLFNLSVEAWTKIQAIKVRATALQKAAEYEKTRVGQGASWSFTETFSSTSNLDMNLTTAWIDSSEGVAELPRNGKDINIKPSELSVVDSEVPLNGSFLGSGARDAWDGLETTNWRVLFTQTNTWASTTVTLNKPSDLSAIYLDPVGFGLEVLVEVDSGEGFKQALKTILYGKKTYPVAVKGASRVKVTFTSVEASLPKTAGFRNIVLFSSTSSRYATIVSKVLTPTQNYSEILINARADIPTGASLRAYYSNNSKTTWKPVTIGQWHTVSLTSTDSTTFSLNSATSEGGLFTYSIGNEAISVNEGLLEVGLNQVEVTANRRDFSTLGEVPHIPVPNDLITGHTMKTWTSPRKIDWNFNLAANYLQLIAEASKLYDSPYNVTAGDAPIFQTKKTVRDFYDLNIVPYVGSKTYHPLQSNYTYKFRYWVFCRQAVNIEDARYWFYQGYRKATPKHSYKELGRSYCGFSFYLNDILNISDSSPATIWDDGTVETDVGVAMDLTLKEGWNKIEILVHTSDPTFWKEENFDNGDPYVQLTFGPSMFDENAQSKYGITRVVGSGQVKPITEFDLLWSVPKDPTFWAWDTSNKSSIKFNARSVSDMGSNSVDGVFAGDSPTCVLSYKGQPSTGGSALPLFVRLDLERESSSISPPSVDDYVVVVK